jgi:hypothetical protein
MTLIGHRRLGSSQYATVVSEMLASGITLIDVIFVLLLFSPPRSITPNSTNLDYASQ